MDRQHSWVATQHYEQRLQQCSCYAFGRNDFGQSGTSTADQQCAIADARAIDSLRHAKVVCVAGGQAHSAFVTADGELFMCGSNENSRLAMKNLASVALPQRASALDTRVVATVACGSNFTVAVTKKGELIGWGAGEYGQIGPPCVMEQAVPRIIKGLPPSVRIERVAAGAAHVLALSEKFQVYSFGVGLHGALGHGNRESVDMPTVISELAYAGVTAIDAGDDHSIALAADGRLWTWGQGTFGALGHDTTESQHTPQQVAALRNSQIVSMAAGGHHTVALSFKGRVYTWGNNTYGQLGVGNCIDASLPCVVEDSSSMQVSQVSAGSKHTMLLTSRGGLLGFGCTERGQLGVLSQAASFLSTPQPIRMRHQEAGMQPVLAIACGDHSLVMCCMQASFPKCMSAMHTCNTRLVIPDLLTLAKAARPLSGPSRLVQDPGSQAQSLINLSEAVRNVFSSPGLLIAGFSVPPPPRAAYDDVVVRSDSLLNLDLAGVKEVYDSILLVLNPDVVLALQSTIATMLQQIYQQEELAAAQGKASAISQAQWLKVLVILFLNPANSDAHGTARQLIESLARVLFVLKARPRKVLLNWLSQLPPDVLGGRCIRPLQMHLTKYVETYGWGKGRTHVLLVGSVVHMLVDANRVAGNPVPYTELHNAAVSKGVMESLQAEWLAWQKVRQGLSHWGAADALPQSLCQIPWIMTPECKKIIMQGEAMLMQNNEVNHSMQRAIFMMAQGVVLMGPHLSHMGQLRVQIRRNHIVADALQQLTMHMEDLHKPLRVTFLSEDGKSKEEAVDEGGVSKEFFQLLIRELFLPDYGMFQYNEDTREYWFSPAALEIGVSKSDFKMVGIVLGLGIFNAVILDVHFPLVVYKKLLKGDPTLEDLEDANPSLASGLKSLLAYDGDDVAEVFCRTFEVEYMVFDTMQTVELKPGGSQIPVTKHNRQEFVDLMVDWYLNKSVADAFEQFKIGFYSVASGSSLVLFNHQELELLICGLPHLDFAALEGAAVYDGGYTAEHPAIKNFWEILHSFTLEQKKSFLSFVTGCNRAPMGGLGKLKLMVQRDGPDSNKLPTSHTCFNALLLPEYASKAKMQDRLQVAIMNAEGFGLQ